MYSVSMLLPMLVLTTDVNAVPDVVVMVNVDVVGITFSMVVVPSVPATVMVVAVRPDVISVVTTLI